MTAETRDVVVTRILDAPLEEAWRAWSDADYVKQWWGPQGFTCPRADIDFREGGTSLLCMSGPGFGDQYSTWEYEVIVPHERFDYILRLSDEHGNPIDPAEAGMPSDFPRAIRNRVAFKPLEDGKTELTVTEYEWPVGPMMEMSKAGLEQCLDKMALLLTSHREAD